MKKAIMSMLTVWMMVSTMFVGLIGFSCIGNVRAPYISHVPFRINSNTEFATMAGIEGWSGIGSPGNPYIIEGYNINGSGYGNCIYIGNTSVYFEVKDSYLHDASGVISSPYFMNTGITLYNVQNGKAANNNASSNNGGGIYLWSSSNNTITNNNASSNNDVGISLWFSSRNSITNNTASNSHYGIYTDYSSSNVITNNTVSFNSVNGIFIVIQSSNNTIANNKAFSNFDDGISLDSSNNNTIANNIASNNWQGSITLLFSNSNTIVNNTASNNGYGIYLRGSFSNTISNNTISSNSRGGFYISSSNSNTIANNTISQNNGHGIFLWESNNNNIANNIASNNDDHGILNYYSNNNTIFNNNISSNSYSGITLYYSSNQTFANNEMVDNGIFIQGDILEYWNTHFIDTTNSVNGKPVYYWKNQTGGIVPLGAGQIILANSTNVVIENQNLSNDTVWILLGFSSNITIANNNWSIYLYSSNNSTIANNNGHISLDLSNNHTIANNNGGVSLRYSSNNTITNNTAYLTNQTGFYLYRTTNNIVANNIASNCNPGIYLYNCTNSTVVNNTVSNNYNGIALTLANNNTIANNTVSSNSNYGITISATSYSNIVKNNIVWNNYRGIRLLSTTSSNKIYHNNFMSNTNQAYDDTNNSNQWDNGYPSGGNYWSDYIGNDSFKGPFQDIPGSDGIGDTPYIIDADSQDNYPLMEPFTNRTIDNYTVLKQGWNLISIPLIQENQTLKKVLEMIDGWYDAVQWYNITDTNDPWKHHKVGKPYGNDISKINESMGFWVHIIKPGDTIFIYNGTQPTQNQSIPLHPGWNLVGYPSLTNRNRTAALNNITFGSEVDAIWTFNAVNKKWEELSGGDYFEVGMGYWVHATTDCEWEVPL